MMKDIQPVKTAIIGCGSISRIFFENFTKRFRIIDLVKCCSKGGASAQAKAAQYEITASTIDEVLADPEIEMVVNLTPPTQHYDIIKAGLEAGKHVYTEKVVTPDFRQALELKALADAKGLYIGCEPDHFLGCSWQCAREYIDGGIIGNVTSIVASTGANIASLAERLAFVNETAGGSGYDFGIYLVTQLVSLLGPAKRVCGIFKTMQPKRVHRHIENRNFGETFDYITEDFAAANIEFANGAVAVFHNNGNTIMDAPQQFIIYGSAGCLSMPNPATFSGDVKLYRAGCQGEPSVLVPAHGYEHDSRGVGAAEMAWAIRLGRKPRSNVDLGIHCLEVIQGMQISGETGQYYELTTTCERPKPLPKGYTGMKGFSFGEEGALALEV